MMQVGSSYVSADVLVLGVTISGALTAAATIAAAAASLRARSYRSVEGLPVPEFVTSLERGNRDGTKFDVAPFEEVKRRLRANHDLAVGLQGRYRFLGVFSISLLFAALAVTSWSLTVATDRHSAHLSAAALDVLALSIVLFLFVALRRWRRGWIEERVRIETLRSWVVTWGLFSFATPAEAGSAYQVEVDRTQSLGGHAMGNLEDAIQDYWTSALESFRAHLVAKSSLPAAVVAEYCCRRVARQARWFWASRSRISATSDRRAWLFGLLFVSALILAGVKLYLNFILEAGSPASSWASFGLLLLIAASTALTAVHYGQNARSLHHRYGTQLRSLQQWIRDNDEIIRRSRSEQSLEAAEIALVADAIVAFEMLMAVELLDWIEITEIDSAELSAS